MAEDERDYALLRASGDGSARTRSGLWLPHGRMGDRELGEAKNVSLTKTKPRLRPMVRALPVEMGS